MSYSLFEMVIMFLNSKLKDQNVRLKLIDIITLCAWFLFLTWNWILLTGEDKRPLMFQTKFWTEYLLWEDESY